LVTLLIHFEPLGALLLSDRNDGLNTSQRFQRYDEPATLFPQGFKANPGLKLANTFGVMSWQYEYLFRTPSFSRTFSSHLFDFSC
jgi:hypothetical protein